MDTDFDNVLKNALTDSLFSDYDGLIEKAEQEEVSFSGKYIRRKNRMLRNPKYFLRQRRRYASVRMFRVIAVAVILMMSLSAGATLMWDEGNLKLEHFPAYAEITTTSDVFSAQDFQAGDFYPGFIPEGYIIYKAVASNDYVNYLFACGNNVLNCCVWRLRPDFKLLVDNENWTYREIVYNLRTAYLLTGNVPGRLNGFIWLSKDGTRMYQISGDIKVQELYKIAKSMK